MLLLSLCVRFCFTCFKMKRPFCDQDVVVVVMDRLSLMTPHIDVLVVALCQLCSCTLCRFFPVIT